MSAIMVAGGVAGCSVGGQMHDTFQPASLLPDQGHGAPTGGPGDLQAVYQVDSNDRLRINVFGQPSLTGEYNVDGAGRLSMPLIGNVPVRGLTTPAIESLITRRLASKYLRDPDVTVEVLTFRPFFILGQVNTAGQYPYVNGMNISQAIAIAGGYTPRANQNLVKLTRVTANGEQTFKVKPETAVYPGDTIYVRERWF